MTFFHDLNKRLAELATKQDAKQITESTGVAESKFSKLAKEIGKNPKVKNPAAVAATIGREKYGQKAMTAKSVAGRKHHEEMDETSYSAKAARAGKDIGKPGKNFSKIAKDAGQRYGSKAAGERVAGAVLAKMRAKESVENFRHNVKFVNESLSYLLQEDEEGKAKTITAASDIVNDYTSWMQRVGQYQTKAIIELADAIKADFGQAEAETFKQSVAPALSATLETLTQQREAISSAVAVLAGEAAPEEPMGMEPDMGADANAGLDMPPPDDMNTPPQAGDEFGAADAAAGDGTTGREMRESREQRRARKLAEEHSIISRLAKWDCSK